MVTGKVKAYWRKLRPSTKKKWVDLSRYTELNPMVLAYTNRKAREQ